MAKLPAALLPRSLPSSTSSALLTSTPRRPTTAIATHTSSVLSSSFGPRLEPRLQQVRHATEVVRPKRPFTWTQIVQLSDGSTYTTRSTSPLPVYRSTKDTRNHLTWQPTERSLQNIEVDEAGKLSSFRGRFGSGYELAGPTPAERAEAEAAAQAAAAAAAAGGGKGGKGRTKAAAAAAKVKEAEVKKAEKAAPEQDEDDSFASLLSGYVVDQPHLKGGRVFGKDVDKKTKKK